VDGSTRSGEARKRACEDNYCIYLQNWKSAIMVR